MISPLQTRVVQLAYSAPNLASTFNQSAFHLGNSLGSWVSGFAIILGIHYQHLSAIGAALASLALATGMLAWRIESNVSRQLAMPAK